MTVPPRLFERTISIWTFLDKFTEPLIFVRSHDTGSRATAIKSLLNPNTTFVEIEHRMSATSQSSTSASINDKIIVYINGMRRKEFDSTSLGELFTELRNYSANLLIDISTMGVRLLALLLTSLAEIFDYQPQDAFNHVYCGYTEPRNYKQSSGKQENGIGYFSFYKSYNPLSPIEGYYSLDGSKACQRVWAVLLGFEGNRIHLLQNELSNVNRINAYITTPSMQLEWVNHVFAHNQHFLQGIDGQRPAIDYIPATSPFATYNKLSDLKEEITAIDSKLGLYISPLGTKANALGALLFLLNDSNSVLAYDNPKEKTRRPERASDLIFIYDISQALRYNRIEGGIDYAYN